MVVYSQTGELDLAHKEAPLLVDTISTCRQLGIDHHVLTSEQVASRWKQIRLPDDYCAVLIPQAGTLHATNSVNMLQRLASHHGAEVRGRVKVVGMCSRSGGGHVVLHTDTLGDVLADKCVLALGPWAHKFLDSNLALPLALSSQQITVAYWHLTAPDTYDDTFPVFLHYSQPYIYGMRCPAYPGTLKVCRHAGQEIDPDTDGLQLDECGIDDVRSFLAMFDGVDRSFPKVTQRCYYTMSPDHEFVIDKIPGHSQILLASACSGQGFKFAPVVGQILADMVASRKPKYDMRTFSIERPGVL
eukprot:TRINITY_DN103243_c0_g1_i1.p1 TRINITY_DN103243_c0_g1~~TRINITY_DN103243_c0_g1_i1.p1  ORF type:complete len:315 (+),score=35.18 TRINITY_DN103243_c0_g1_i1:43-945(+)